MTGPAQRIEFDVGALDPERIAALLTLGGELVAETDLEKVLTRALADGRRITGARYAAIGILDSDRRRLERFETSGIDEATRRRIGDPPQGHGILGLLIREPKPLRLDDVGSHPRSYGFPVGHPPMRAFLGAPIRIGEEVWGNFYLCEKESGEPFTAADEEAIVLLAGFVGVAVANSKNHRAAAQRVASLQRAVEGLEATTAISRAVGDETDLDRVLELVVKRGRALVDGRASAALLLDGDELVVARVAGELGDELEGRRMDALESLCGDVLRSGRTRRFDEIADDPRLAPLAGHGLTSIICAPLYLRGRVLGVLAVADRIEDGPGFTEDDERLIDAFAASAATAVAISQNVAAEGLRRAIDASERERTRWAREIHDDALQELAALKLALSRARRAGGGEERGAALDLAEQQVVRAIDGLRGLVTELRPAALDELGTAAAIRLLAERAARNGGITVDVRLDLDFEEGRQAVRPTPAIEETIYRVVQEALSNVVRHANAAVAEVSVVESGGAITVRVRDHGLGMSGEASGESFGLIGMRERLELIQGTLRIESTPGAGTLVEAIIPARRAEAQPPPGA